MKHLSPSRHPLIAIVAAGAALAVVTVLALVFVVLPLANGIGQAPGQFAQWYGNYWDGVGQQFQQAQQPGGQQP